MSPGRRVAVVVLNWNGWPHTLACLDSVEPAVLNGTARLIVVDNASSDHSVARIRDWFHSRNHRLWEARLGSPHEEDAEYILISAPRNGGYAAGNNLGIKLALDLAATEYVFLLNNDARVEPTCIQRLVEWADRDTGIGIVGSTLIEDVGRILVAGGSKYNPLLTISRPALATGGGGGRRIDYVAGAAQFIRADAFKRVGLLSEDYFLYFEELDLTRRVTGAGLRIEWCPSAVVYHECGRSTGGRSGANKGKSMLSEYHSNLSCLIFMRKFHPRLLWFAAPVRFALKVFHDVINFQPALTVPLFRAYRDYLFGARGRSA